MKKEDLLKAVSMIDDDLIAEYDSRRDAFAAKNTSAARRIRLKRLAALAAVLAVLAGAVAAITVASAHRNDARRPEPIDLAEHMRAFESVKGDEPITVSEIIDEVKEVCDSGAPIKITSSPDNSYIGVFASNAGRTEYRDIAEKGSVVVDFSEKPYDDNDVYLMFLTALAELKDRVYNLDTDRDILGQNRIPFYAVLYSEVPFEELGYDNAKDACYALRNGDCMTNYNVVYFNSRIINGPFDPSAGAKQKNIFLDKTDSSDVE